ncbi:MAG: DEAD/DEAH box helicase [Chloroflexota bacterium]|nr:DEAD/DEAH box helicase [Chloroflexota bacterium]
MTLRIIQTIQNRFRKNRNEIEEEAPSVIAPVKRERIENRTIEKPETTIALQTKSRERRPPVKKAPSPRPKWNLSQFQVAPVEGKTRFHDLDLPIDIIHAIADLGFEYCTPIQAEVLPKTLTGVDATGRAQTGTGKSAAFLIAVLTHLQRKPISGERRPGTPRALVIEPTRELALQVKKDANLLSKYSRCRTEAVFGGMDYQKQKQMLSEKVVDIVVATPGRLLDFKRQRDIDLSQIEILILDEADHMLDMGFIPDVRQIIQSTPPKSKRQTMLFGATLTPGHSSTVRPI